MTTTVDEHDRPILFTGWSIRRIFDDAKTETRRRTGLDAINEDPDRYTNDTEHGFWSDGEYYRVLSGRDGVGAKSVKSPYGGPYDPLWVREAFRLPEGYDEMSPSNALRDLNCSVWKYEADDNTNRDYLQHPSGRAFEWGRLRPSIHMPTELCRLRLRLKSVHLQRLQDIGVDAVLREGIEQAAGPDGHGTVYGREDAGWTNHPVTAFRNLFSEIHSREVWDRNEWVWVLRFYKMTN